jgi:tetratricopeptide (TPR) repeat protein
LRRDDLKAARPLLEKAVAELREAERLDPARADAHYRLGRVYEAMGRRREAQAELAIVKRLESEQAEDALHKVSGRPPALPVP